MLAIFGIVITNRAKFRELGTFNFELGRRQGFEDGISSVATARLTAAQHLRDLVHNLPFHLHFETPDEIDFAHDVLCRSWDVVRPPLKNPGEIPFIASPALRRKLVGRAPLHAGNPIDEGHFERAAKGDLEAALYITNVIFCINRPRYKRDNEWYEKPLNTAVGSDHE